MTGNTYLSAFIEISAISGSVKYECDKSSGRLIVDRIMPSAMIYPGNYGFIEGTIGGDGDPLDVLVHASHTILPGSIVKIRPIGVLVTEDEAGEDAKIIALPLEKVDPFMAGINDIHDLPQAFLDRISHFFSNYKTLEPNKWVKIVGWGNESRAREIIDQSILDFQKITEIIA